MQDELTWMDSQSSEESAAKERYEYFTRPEPRENMSDIYYEDDPYLGKAKCRDLRIGLVRNAAEDNKKVVKAYLEPFPHIRIDNAKPLQGWYQSMINASKQSRPRPCFTEAVLTEPYGGYCAVGCQFSLPAGELVDTPTGPKTIEMFQIGETVWGKQGDGTIIQTTIIGVTKHQKPEGLIQLTFGGLSTTLLRMTGDHPIYSCDKQAWVAAAKLTLGEYVEHSSGARLPLEKTELIPGEVTVYDIQTVTGNFYQRGVLVHNCYINSGMRGYRGTGLISVPLNYGEQIKEQLSKMRRSAAGYFSSFTDPFTPLEQYYHNTQQAAQAFVDVGLPIFFLSRLKYPDWAVDMLTKNVHSYAQKSLNTCDPEDWRKLSPGALPLMEHLKDITRLKKRGIYVSIQVNPIVAGVTSNEQIMKLFEMLKKAGADHVIVKFVEAAYSWAPAVVERITKVFGQERGAKFAALFVDNIGSERTIEEGYRLAAHKVLSAKAKKLGLTYATCYEYRYERNEAGKIISKTGVSIGREYTTASQCHGHTVPMYTRNRTADKFAPVEECPPSGCLYCASENEGKPRCGDELAGQAVAMKFADYKSPIGFGKAKSIELPLLQ